jgi:hypothetical protein
MFGIARKEQFEEYLIFGEDIDEGRHYVKPMVNCPYCKAFVWPGERSICCMRGTITLPPLDVIPGVVQLLGGQTAQCKRFRNSIRRYNAALSFTSLGADVDRDLANGRQGVYTFRVCGQVSHKIGSLLPEDGRPAKFAQIYTLDPAEQVECRLANFNNLERGILENIQRSLQEVNRFCQLFKSIREREDGYRPEELRIILRADQTTQQEAQGGPEAQGGRGRGRGRG